MDDCVPVPLSCASYRPQSDGIVPIQDLVDLEATQIIAIRLAVSAALVVPLEVRLSLRRLFLWSLRSLASLSGCV
jgi:hypothetical protein